MKTILVVDDELTIVEMLSAVLEDEGYQVMKAHNGQEGLACLAKLRPALILCDLMMPVLDGRGMCRSIQSNPNYRSIPIVLMSAVGKALSISHSECNFAAFLAKPFDIDSVLSTITHLINTSSSS